MNRSFYWLLIVFSGLFWACEEEFIPEINNDAPQFVVESYIEAGEGANPPFVVLTRTLPFFETIDEEILNDLFVHDAVVNLSNGQDTVQLTEVCFNNLGSASRDLFAEFLGVGSIDQIGLNICVYIELSPAPLMGVEGGAYQLDIVAEGTTIRASTTIPFHVPLDSLDFRIAPENDSLVELRGFVSDPADQIDFYRYFTQRNEEPLFSGVASVIDDKFFNGQSFEFPLQRGQLRTDEIDFNTFGFFNKGDTIQVKWATLDEQHFNFWNTLEFNSQSDGPFTSFTRIDSNIENGLGVFGGYGVSYHSIIIPE
ncbi:MAG: DUF4249 domain-containing protein [Bacteroidota bacterium]